MEPLPAVTPREGPAASVTQQEFLRAAAKTLGLTQAALAQRMGAPWTTFEKWLLPPDAGSAREMPAIAWQLAREILEHEKLKQNHEALKGSVTRSAK